jgi:hypothetical protein
MCDCECAVKVLATFNAYTDYEVDIYSKAIRQNRSLEEFYRFLRGKIKHGDHSDVEYDTLFAVMSMFMQECSEYLSPGE